MATLAKIADALSGSPAVQKLPVAELGLQLERQSRLDVMIAARDRAIAELGLGSSLASLAKEAIIGWPPAASSLAEIGLSSSSLATCLATMDRFSLPTGLAGGDRYGIQQQLEQIHAGGAALQATFDRAIMPEGLFSSFSESVKVAMPKGLLAGIEVSANLFGTIDHRAFIDSFGLSADTAAASLSAGRVFGQIDQSEWRKQIEAMLTPRVDWHEQLAGIYGLPGQSYEIVGLADAALWARQAPAVIARRPEPQLPPKRLPPPQSDTFGIQPAQPGQPADWREILVNALRAGQATTESIVQWLLQQDRGSQPLPLWADIEVIALDYQQNGSRYKNMDAFANKYRLHRATVDRYLRMYEAATGEQIRPGQGRAKRLSRR